MDRDANSMDIGALGGRRKFQLQYAVSSHRSSAPANQPACSVKTASWHNQSATLSIPSPRAQLVVSGSAIPDFTRFGEHALEIDLHKVRDRSCSPPEDRIAIRRVPRLRGMSSPPATSMTNTLVDELSGKCRCEIISATFDENEIR